MHYPWRRMAWQGQDHRHSQEHCCHQLRSWRFLTLLTLCWSHQYVFMCSKASAVDTERAIVWITISVCTCLAKNIFRFVDTIFGSAFRKLFLKIPTVSSYSRWYSTWMVTSHTLLSVKLFVTTQDANHQQAVWNRQKLLNQQCCTAVIYYTSFRFELCDGILPESVDIRAMLQIVRMDKYLKFFP